MHAEKDHKVVIKNDETVSIGNNQVTTIGNTEKRTVAKDFKGAGPSRTTVIEKGDDKLDVNTGAILHTAKTKIELTVGPSKITIDPTGIKLEAPKITLNATGICEIYGGLVKINS
jgi:type VI secretion system secreted protein VgrG